MASIPSITSATDLESMWPERYIPDWYNLENAKKEGVFGEASFELLKEAGVYSILVSGLIPKKPHQRNNAILCALALKASKLTKAIIAMTSHLGGDRQLALIRELIEALSILNYLLDDEEDGARFDKFINDSLVSEREFLKAIRSNISMRSSTLPVEESMMRSIDSTARAAGIEDLTQIPSRKEIGWPNAELLIAQISSELYLSYRAGSSVIHTQWHDLLSNHLIQLSNGTFEPDFDDPPVRPQPLYGAGLILILVLREYLTKTYPEALEQFEEKLNDLHERFIRVVQLHDTFQNKKNN